MSEGNLNATETGRTLEFPLEVMTGAAGEFAKVHSERLEACPQFLYMAYLTCLGTALADKLTLETFLHPQPRLYTLLLGESAAARKSTAISTLISFFQEACPEGLPVCWGVGSAEGLQKALSKRPTLLLCMDEIKAFLGKTRIESSTLLPCVSTLFESNKYESQTKEQSVLLEKAHLSILAASTIQTYAASWTAAASDIGFNNRLWLVPGGPGKRVAVPKEIPNEELTWLRDHLRAVLLHVGKFLKLSFEPEAERLYANWYERGLTHSSFHAKRLDTYAMRFMTLLAANDLKNAVDVETVQKVLKLCQHQFEVRQLYDPIDADSRIARMEETIRRRLRADGALTVRDLRVATNAARAGLELFEKAVDNLIRSGEVVRKGQKAALAAV